MDVRWSLPAADDLERICARIERDHPDVARRVARTIYDACTRLAEFPHRGRRSSRLEGWRELTFSSLPYVVVYRVQGQTVEIARIYHGAQDWP